MSVASATRAFAAGTTAEDTLCRCVTGKDSSVAFIESSANLGTVSPASCGAPTHYGRVVYVPPRTARTAGRSYVNRSSVDTYRRRRHRRSWHLSGVVEPGGCPDAQC